MIMVKCLNTCTYKALIDNINMIDVNFRLIEYQDFIILKPPPIFVKSNLMEAKQTHHPKHLSGGKLATLIKLNQN